MTILILVFKKIENKDKIKYGNFYSSSKAGIIINETNIDNLFESIFTTIMENMQKSSLKDSGWIIDHAISISKYNPLAGSSYMPKKG